MGDMAGLVLATFETVSSVRPAKDMPLFRPAVRMEAAAVEGRGRLCTPAGILGVATAGIWRWLLRFESGSVSEGGALRQRSKETKRRGSERTAVMAGVSVKGGHASPALAFLQR
jgi:hypothetical protein